MQTSHVRSLALASCLAAFTAPAPGQIVVEVRTVMPWSASTRTGTTSVPANAWLASGDGVLSEERLTGCTALATSALTFAGTATTADLLLLDHAVSGSSFGTCTSGRADTGPNALRVSLRAPAPIAGQLRITVAGTGSRSFNQARATCSIDVDEDGAVEFAGDTNTTPTPMLDGSVELPWTVGPTPRTLLLNTSATAFPPYFLVTRGDVSVRVEFRAGSGRLDRVGDACGPQHTGALLKDHDGWRLRLDATSAQQAPMTWLAVGQQTVALPLPPTGCVLRTDPFLALPAVWAGGRWSFTVPLPDPLPRFAVRTQIAECVLVQGVPHWHLSEALHLRLP